MTISEDITERKQREEALQRRAVHQQQLLGAVRHLTASLDLTEVLTRIAATAKAILEAYGSDIYLLEADGKTLTPVVALDQSYEQEILSTPLDVENSLTGLAVKARHGLIINDAVSAPLGFQVPGTPVDKDERVIVVPFMIQDKVLGAMCVSRMGTLFSEQDLTLAEAFAAYAATALKNAQTHRELEREMEERKRAQEALARHAREMAALYETSLEINSQPDVPSLLHAIVERATGLLGAAMGGLYLMRPDGKTLELVVSYNLPRDYTGTLLPLGEGLSGRIAQTGEPMTIEDYNHWEGQAAVYASSFFRRVLGVPLKVRGRVIGVLNVTDDQKTGAFDEDEIRLVSLFADQAAIAVENARLYQNVVTEAERRVMLYRATREIGASVDREQIAVAIHQAAAQVMPVESVVIGLLVNGEEIENIYLYDAGQRWPGARYPVGPGLTSYIITTGKALRTDNINDEKMIQETGAKDFGVTADKPLAAIAVPLRLGSKVIGMLSIQSYAPSRYTPEDQDLLEMLAAYGATAFENARLYAEVRRHAEELEQQTRELQSRNEELDAFAHTVAHDLNNPIGLTLGYAETLVQDYTAMSDGQRQQFLQTIARNARKMKSIVEELLLLTQVRKTQVEMGPLDMAEIVSEAQQRLADMVEQSHAEIERHDASAWPKALGYAPWVEEVWVNYLSNAIKYGGGFPHVELGADRLPNPPAQAGEGGSGDMVRFWVRDNGPGIPLEAQSRLFTPLTRLDQVRARGYGLGLSIVRRIVEKLGGQVGMESDGVPGHGSLFYFTLPGASGL